MTEIIDTRQLLYMMQEASSNHNEYYIKEINNVVQMNIDVLIDDPNHHMKLKIDACQLPRVQTILSNAGYEVNGFDYIKTDGIMNELEGIITFSIPKQQAANMEVQMPIVVDTNEYAFKMATPTPPPLRYFKDTFFGRVEVDKNGVRLSKEIGHGILGNTCLTS